MNPLSGVRILEVAQFAPDAVGMHLADLGAEVIKVESPGLGDPARLLGKPIDGEAPATRRWNRGKLSLALDLRSEEGVDLFLELVAKSDALIEGMRPGSLERRGLSRERLLEANPKLVWISVSGWGETGPYRDLGSHGLAFDAFAGLAPARIDRERPTRPSGHVWQGLEAAPLYGALAVVSCILQARLSGAPSRIEVCQVDAAVVWNGWRVAYERARSEASDDSERLEAYAASAEFEREEAELPRIDTPDRDVRYQYYAARDGLILLMATERRFWENFCTAIDRADLFERWPGRGYADHDYGNEALRQELGEIFAARTQAEWVELFLAHDVAGAPVYDAAQMIRDPHFESRQIWTEQAVHGLEIPGSPLRIDGVRAVAATPSPTHAEHSKEILRRVLDYDDERLDGLIERRVVEWKP